MRQALIRRFFSTVNRGEMNQFDQISEWWHPSGPMHILYKYNYERVQFLREYLDNRGHLDPLRPLQNLRILDVGCGAGFLSKSLARLGAEVIGLDPNATSFR
jgi:2-polyprenyl-3-methyl-5-hydroxy-6-metoxy-1,4-benzoquinol methylase